MQPSQTATQSPSMDHIGGLDMTLKQLLSSNDQELIAGDARALIGYVEHWAENYTRGFDAKSEISSNEMEMLKKTREQLALILNERQTLEDEGGQPATKEQASRMQHVASAICYIDQILPNPDSVLHRHQPPRKRA